MSTSVMMGPMRIPGSLAPITGLVAVLACAPLSGCALLDGSSRVEEALEYLPAGATTVTFVDRAALADRGGSDEEDEPADAYVTELARWSAATDAAAFGEDDVEWEATATSGAGVGRVWKMVDDLDFDAVAADLEDAGYRRTGPDDRPTFTADPAAADGDLLTLALVPDEEVILSGSDVPALLDAVEDDADSLADAGTFGDLLEQAEDQDALEYAALTLDAPCAADGVAVYVASDEPVRAVRLFADERAAEDDAASVDALLDAWQPSPEDGPRVEVTTDGRAVRVESDFAERSAVIQAFAGREGPFGCAATDGLPAEG
ncbi:hypothetical protein ACJ5H2_04695 [Nocardioides sp. R1-1]|uniref:hypothetical protein n=1 Tax=Nocardioides sp. R1-1 TaxID=3383502 RepID=UPI0038D02609